MPERIKEAFKLAVDEAIPNDKEFAKRIYNAFIIPIDNSGNSDLNSEYGFYQFQLTFTQQVKDLLIKGDRTNPGIDANSIEFQEKMFFVVRVLITLMFKIDGTSLSQKKEFGDRYTKYVEEQKFKYSHNAFYVQQYDIVLEYLERKIQELSTHASSVNKNHYFISTLSSAQKKILIQELKEQKYTSTPGQLVNFLAGDNEASFTINDGMEHHIAYLLYLLTDGTKKYISINKGTGFFKHFESHDGRKMGSVGMAELKRQVLSSKYNKKQVQQDVQKIMDRLKTKGIPIFIPFLPIIPLFLYVV